MTKEKLNEVKKIYYGILAENPDYPAWQDFEIKSGDNWIRADAQLEFYCQEYRYNPLPKKWEPKNAQTNLVVVSDDFTSGDLEKLQKYATKLSWLRDQGGVDIHDQLYYIWGKELVYNSGYGGYDHDIICMNKHHAEQWCAMINNGEV